MDIELEINLKIINILWDRSEQILHLKKDMDNKYIKRCSTFVSIRETQFKTLIKYHSMARIKDWQ